MEPIIRIDKLDYSYTEKHKILDQIDLEISSDEVFVLLGHNGAGKTTLIRILLDFLRGYKGRVEIFGHSPDSEIGRKRIGFMSEQPVVYDYETVSGYLNYFADLAEISDKGGRIEELLELTGLARHREKKLSQYSKGMLQRLNLARALLNDPDLLIMDEPVIGLDPLGQDLIEKVVISRKKAGKAVFINTHAVSFAAKMADRVGFLMGGRLKKIFNREEFEKGTFPYVYEISCPNDEVYEKFLAEFEMKEKEELMARFVVKDVDESEKLLNMIVSTSSRILHVAANQEVLEKAFLEYSADLSLEDRAR
jgi:ABC-type multidrug transport system ATPase subunit